MILVEYLPADETSPFPDPLEFQWRFEDHQSFKDWAQKYVCVHCLIDYEDFRGLQPKTLKHWLDMGCGCEIFVEDPQKLIDWDADMEYTEAYEKAREEYMMEKNS